MIINHSKNIYNNGKNLNNALNYASLTFKDHFYSKKSQPRLSTVFSIL